MNDPEPLTPIELAGIEYAKALDCRVAQRMLVQATEEALAKMREVEAAHPGITFIEGARLLGWLPAPDLTLADWKLLQTILIDHAAYCMRTLKEIDVHEAGMLLYKRQEDTWAIQRKIGMILRELESDDEADEA